MPERITGQPIEPQNTTPTRTRREIIVLAAKTSLGVVGAGTAWFIGMEALKPEITTTQETPSPKKV